MYLRKSERKNKDGSKVEYISLAVNEWDSERRRSVAKIVHNFGRFREANKKELISLAVSIAKAFDIELTIPKQIEDIGTVVKDPLPANITQHITKSFGPVLALENIWERIGLGELLRRIAKEANCEVPYERALLAMTLNRLCDPESKLGVWDRWLKKVYLPSCEGVKLDHMYEAMDLLIDHTEEVEKEAKRQNEHRENILGKLVEILASHKDHKADHKWAIELQSSKRYSRYLKVDENGDIKIDPDKVKKAKRLDGKWALITNDDTISVEDTAAGYKGLMIIERCFRTLKKVRL